MWRSLGYFVRSAVIPSDAFAGGVPLQTYFASSPHAPVRATSSPLRRPRELSDTISQQAAPRGRVSRDEKMRTIQVLLSAESRAPTEQPGTWVTLGEWCSVHSLMM